MNLSGRRARSSAGADTQVAVRLIRFAEHAAACGCSADAEQLIAQAYRQFDRALVTTIDPSGTLKNKTSR
jgi:hypothetical protein